MQDERSYSRSAPRVAYLRRAGDGAPVLLLHGVGSSASTWRRLLPQLDPALDVIAPDLRGHGESEGVVDTVDDFVDDAVRLLDELGLTAVDVVGFSLGAIIAERLAVVHPDRVRSLVLLNSIGDRTDEERERALERLESLRTTRPADSAPRSAARWFTREFIAEDPAAVAEEVAIVAAVRPDAYEAAYRVLATTDLIDQVGAIRCPTLIVTGENDVGSTPRMSRAVHDRVAGSRLTIIDRLRHYLHVEDPRRVAGLVNEFLDAVHHPSTR
jgi:pimeloyl-ACP methyl ester carboxylesterase